MPKKKPTELSPPHWMGDIRPAKTLTKAPEIGVRIECRLLIKNAAEMDWIREIIDQCRQYGAAEVVEIVQFNKP